MEVNVHKARTQFLRLLGRVESGEEIVITRAGKPVARLLPVAPKPGSRPMGPDVGRFKVPEDFDEPLPWDVLFNMSPD